MIRRALGIGAVALLMVGAPESGAQQAGRQGAPAGESREALERRVRERIGVMLRERLQLTEQQATQLQQSMARTEERRRQLLQAERDLRGAMRVEMARGDSANQPRLGQLIDQLVAVQGQRLELVGAEQRELAGFLTPLQRARYLTMQDNLRRMLDERVGRPGGPRAQPPGRGPGARPPGGRAPA